MSISRVEQAFKEYGLTQNQTRILHSLIQKKECVSVKQISLITNIARESIYVVLKELKEKGLVIKTITKPKKYCAISLKTILFLLYEQKNSQIHELSKLTTDMLLEYDKTKRLKQIEEKSQFLFIPKNKELKHRISKTISSAKKSIKIVTSWNRHLKALNIYEFSLKKALSNGVQIQVFVTEKPDCDDLPKEGKVFYDHSNTLVKFSNTKAKTIVMLIDDEEMFLMTNPKAHLTDSPAIWSNNRSLIDILKTFFEVIYKPN